MHEKVSCTGCHTKPVFTDVGKNCADCHADIHRAQFGKNCAQCHTVLGWQVSDIASAAEALTKAGVEFARYPGMDQDQLGIWSSPSGAKVAWFHDPDGNTLSLSQH